MVAWADILEWRSELLEAPIQSAHDRRLILERVADELATEVRVLQAQGLTADAVRASLSDESRVADDLVAQFSELMLASAEAKDGVWDVETRVHECVTFAEIEGIIISSTGSLSMAAWKSQEIFDDSMTDGAGQVATDYEIARLALVDAIQVALDKARLIADEYGARLGALDRLAGSEGADAFSQGLPDRPDPDWSATEVAAWWRALSRDEKDQIIQFDPDAVANLDGIDAASRDAANRNRLDALIEDAQAEVDAALVAHDAHLANSDTWDERVSGQELLERYELALLRLRDLEQVNETLKNWPEAQLLLLDTTSGEHTRAAIGLGDVDRATSVATFVPGMNTTVRDSLGGYVDFADSVRDISIRAGNVRSSDVATVVWMGYDAPNITEVASTASAVEGADLLNGFVEGMQASRTTGLRTGDPYQTVFAHSYGSTTSGMMAAEVNIGVVDNIVMFGSPGSGVQDVREFNLDSGGAYVSGVDSRDSVQGMGPDHTFGVNPMKLHGVEHLSNETYAGENTSADLLFGNHSSYIDVNGQDGASGFALDLADVIIGGK
ncbi:hypothetical protein EG850_13010 [Gulosibacter macacae]|uniref:DUF1023 domain-containing protein n=1 Tax=Gulosibacter macacae TaxID=2488791 RepID=A0A3P3VSX1_9MICO|nr:alpha/beta hydrolase [Gulosibacter macacae]RRJ85554.1 hypothetical protein EG850_13010 [Gulosibacter macacae]